MKGILPFKMHKIIFFQKTWTFFLGFTSKFTYGRVTLNTCFFLFGLVHFASLTHASGAPNKVWLPTSAAVPSYVLESHTLHVKLIITNILVHPWKVSNLILFEIPFCLFVWFDSLRPINNLSVIKGQFFLGWTRTKLGLMFLLKDTTQWGSNLQPLGHKSSTLPLRSLLKYPQCQIIWF